MTILKEQVTVLTCDFPSFPGRWQVHHRVMVCFRKLRCSLEYNKNRAKLAWYNIEPILQDRNSVNNPLRKNAEELSDPRVRAVYNQELYPQRTNNLGENQLITFDLADIERYIGPYNYESNPSQVDADGS